MFNFKWGIIAGAIALVLSLLIGLISSAGFPTVFIRAGILTVVFFVLGCGIWWIINNFIPELLHPDAPDQNNDENMGEIPGSRVNITIDDNRGMVEIYRNLGSNDDVGDIGELVAGTFKPQEIPVAAAADRETGDDGIDLTSEDNYTNIGNRAAQLSSGNSSGLPDLEAMTGSFMNSPDDGPLLTPERPEPVRTPTGNKPMKLSGDFDPKELAAGIRTVLSKDE